jgi:hypothetical protein
MPNITVQRKPSTTREESFLIRGVGKRSLTATVQIAKNWELVWMEKSGSGINLKTNISYALTEYELFYLIRESAFEANRRGWRNYKVFLRYAGYSEGTRLVEMANGAGHLLRLGTLMDYVDAGNFLNDSYYYPKGSLIG